MNIKSLALIFTITFLLLLNSSSKVKADDVQSGLDAFNKKDFKTAYQLFFKLAKQDDAKAQFHLGMMYGKGRGVPQDDRQAVKWWRLAAEQGNGKAQLNMGTMYYIGEGVLQDYKEAAKWFQLSAEQGYARAQLNLGTMYYIGEGVLKDYTLAHMWWDIASSNGYKNAVIRRNILQNKMSQQQIEKAQEMAKNWKPKIK